MEPVISPEDAAKIAEYFLRSFRSEDARLSFRKLHEDLRKPSVRAELGVNFKKRFPSQKTVERAIYEAIASGRVQVEIVEQWEEPVIDEALSKDLLQKYRDYNVDHYVVCDVSDVAKKKHSAMVGNLAAHYLLENTSFFRSRDRIGVGSGRSVQGLTQSMLRQMRKPIEDVELFAMAGHTLPSNYPRNSRELFNADQNVYSLSSYFSRGARVNLVAGRLAYDKIEVARNNCWLSRLNKIQGKFVIKDELHEFDVRPLPPYWDPPVSGDELLTLPNTAIVGAGALTDGHILYDLVKGRLDMSKELVADYLNPISEVLTKIIEESDTLYDRYQYSAVGEVCNRYFLTDCPEEYESNMDMQERRKKIHGLLVDITEKKILCTPKRLFSLLDRLAIVTAGPEKSFAVKTLIKHPMVKVSYLFVDSELAKRLLD
jgi:hypothetical protein